MRRIQARQGIKPQRRGVVLRLETLEDRTVPSTFLVSNLNDSGAGSLRTAVQSQRQSRLRDRLCQRSARHHRPD